MKHQLTPEHVESFVRNLYIEEKSQATMKKYRHDVNVFVNFLDGMDVDKEVVIRYKEYLLRTYQVASANSMLAALNHFLKFLGWDECCVKALKTQRALFYASERFLSRGDYQRLLRTAEQENVRLARIMETICTTGIRISELNFVTVEALKQGRVEVTNKGKTRTVFLAPGVNRKLTDYCMNRGIRKGPVFITAGGKPLNRSNIWADMKRICEKAGVDAGKVFPHNLRHLFAYTYYDMDKDLVHLADLLGHSNIETTRVYTKEPAVAQCENMEKIRTLLSE